MIFVKNFTQPEFLDKNFTQKKRKSYILEPKDATAIWKISQSAIDPESFADNWETFVDFSLKDAIGPFSEDLLPGPSHRPPYSDDVAI